MLATKRALSLENQVLDSGFDDILGFADDGLLTESVSLDADDSVGISLERPKKRGRKQLSHKRDGGDGEGGEEMRFLLDDPNNLAGLGMQGRRSRRMRPIDGKKELVVLFPNDDPIGKLQLEKSEIPEFVCCMEEKFDWVMHDGDDQGGDADGHSHGSISTGGAYGNGNATTAVGRRSKDILVESPRGTASISPRSSDEVQEVMVPASRVDEHCYQYRAGQAAFMLPILGSECRGYEYSTYDLDSDDEDFLHAWQNGKGLREPNPAPNPNKAKPVLMRGAKGQTLQGAGATAPLDEQGLSELLVALEREYEQCKPLIAENREIEKAKTKCHDYIDACAGLTIDADSFDGSTDDITTLETALKAHRKHLDAEKKASATASKGSGVESTNSLSSLVRASSVNSEGTVDTADMPGQGRREDLTELPVVTRAELGEAVPRHAAQRVLVDIYRSLPIYQARFVGANTSSTAASAADDGRDAVTEAQPQTDSAFARATSFLTGIASPAATPAKPTSSPQQRKLLKDNESQLRSALLVVYEYWLRKRSTRRSSILRCYHSFIMENWRHQAVLPMTSEDYDTKVLLRAHKHLVKLRHGLDRARLIMDRVRRREKVKRELVRIAGDTTDDYLHSLKIGPNISPQEPSINAGGGSGKGGKGGKGCEVKAEKGNGGKYTKDASSSSRQPRAAKSLAISKLDSTSSISASNDDDNNDDDDGAEHTQFTLDETDYENLEVLTQAAVNTAIPVEAHATLLNARSSSAHGNEQGYYSDYDPRRTAARSQNNRYENTGPSNQISSTGATGWTADEDRLLLMGVAACGVGRWTEIREDFLLARNSAQMNQRFTRLARRRCVLVKINAASSGKRTSSANSSGGNSNEGGDDSTPEYTEVRTAFMSPQEIAQARAKLPPLIVDMLQKYSDDNIWESIALRHLVDMQSKDKRCGRPQKYPVPIPIPKHLQNGGFMSRRKLTIQRPSELGYSWKGKTMSGACGSGCNGTGAIGSNGDTFDYSSGNGSYQRGSYSKGGSSSGAISPTDSQKKRARGRPRKNSLPEDNSSETDDNVSNSDRFRDSDSPVSAVESPRSRSPLKATLNSAGEPRRMEQGLTRAQRALVREHNNEIAANLEMVDSEDDDENDVDREEDDNGEDEREHKKAAIRSAKNSPARCSLGSLKAPNSSAKKSSTTSNSNNNKAQTASKTSGKKTTKRRL